MSEPDDATRQDKPLRQSQPKLAALPDFGPRYRAIGMLGKGGMGEVYRAYDAELKVEVALKIVRDDSDYEAALARFRREIALARKVTSPHVLRVYDLAEHDGLRFLSMELVDGEDLAALMRREKRMPLPRAVAIFRQVCEGLVAAHAQGVVHRDLKPQNVLVGKDDLVRVADFGLARSIGESGLTQSGALLGSPAYMSPEQVKGDDTDERSDIYSLGIMLYQLVTGEPPFQAPTPHAVMEMRLHKRPKLLRDVRPDAPANLEAICAKCLALAPSARYATVGDVLAALRDTPAPRKPRPRWLVPAIAAVPAIAIVAYIAWPRAHEAPHATAAPPPVAVPPPAATDSQLVVLVLGFENRALEPLFDGTLEDALDSILRRSTRIDPFSGTELQQIANELGPDVSIDEQLADKLAARDHKRVATVRGAIAAKGTAFTLSIVVREATTHQVIFEAKADAPSRERVLPVLANLATQLREKLGEKLAADERERTGLSPVLEADHEYAIARAMARADDDSGALAHLRAAIAKDPKFAGAHQLLAIVYSNAGRSSDADNEGRLALQYMDQLGERERLKALADYYDQHGDYERAAQTYSKVLATWPTDLGAETDLSIVYLERGELDKSLEVGDRAIRHHPRDVILQANQAETLVQAEQLDRAIQQLQGILTSFARPPESTYEALGIAYLLTGDRARCLGAYDEFAKVDPSGAMSARADLAIAEGRIREARRLLDEGIAADRKSGAAEALEIKETMVAELELRRGNKAAARAAADAVTKQPRRLFDAAIVQLAAGGEARALATAKRLADDPTAPLRAFAKWIEGDALRAQGKPEQAMIAIQDGLKLFDLPTGHFRLAIAALDAKRYADAYGELQYCLQHRGRMSIDSADVLTYREVVLAQYELAKAQDGLGSDSTKAYRDFLAMLHEPDADDPLVVDARKHVKN